MEQKFYICKHCGNILPGRDPQPGGKDFMSRKFSNDSLKISRSTSTNVYPCEINAKVDADVFDNAWLPLYSGTWLMTTTVNSGGTMTLTWN